MRETLSLGSLISITNKGKLPNVVGVCEGTMVNYES